MERTENAESNVKEKSLSSKIVYEIKHWSLNTTCHGIGTISKAAKIVWRIIWVTYFLAAISGCIYFAVDNVSQYLRFDTTSEMRTITFSQLRFPEVLICNENPFLTHRADTYIRDYFRTNFNLTIESTADFFSRFTALELVDQMDKLVYELNLLNATEQRKFAPAFEELFFDAFYYDKRLTSDDFTWFFDPTYGNCYRFNSAESTRNSTRSQYYDSTFEGKGLYFQMFTGLPDTMYDNLFLTINRGVKIEVREQNSYPYLINPMLISTGLHWDMKLTKTIINTLPYPYSACRELNRYDSVLYNEMVKLNMAYSRHSCILLAFQKFIIDTRGCYDLNLPRILDARPCPTANELDFEKFMDENENLLGPCPFECESNIYYSTTSASNYPTAIYGQYLLAYYKDYFKRVLNTSRPTFEMIRDSFVSVEIYFEDLKVTKIVESPKMEAVNLLSNIGGTFGLFVGMSLCTMGEVVQLAINVILVSCAYFVKQRNRKAKVAAKESLPK